MTNVWENLETISPLLFLGVVVLVTLPVFWRKSAGSGRYVDAEMQARGASALLGMRPRQYFSWLMRPVVECLVRAQIPAHAVTMFSLLLAIGSGLALAAGQFSLGGWLLVVASLCDYFDGKIARRTGTASPVGALLDSAIDRYVEGAVFCGLAWYYRASWVLVPALLAIVGSYLVSYLRSRAEALGVKMSDVGFMQRPERMFLLTASLLFAPMVDALIAPAAEAPVHWLTVVGVSMIAAATQVTAVQRLRAGLSRLDGRQAKRSTNRRGSLFRSLVVATAATSLDLVIVVALVSQMTASPEVATFAGAILGGVTSFSLGRFWVFESCGGYGVQAIRYAIVSLSGAGLNAAGVGLVLLLPEVSYLVAWGLARGLVFLTWNFPLHRDWVFEHGQSAAGQAGL